MSNTTKGGRNDPLSHFMEIIAMFITIPHDTPCAFMVEDQWYEFPRWIVKEAERQIGKSWTNAKILNHILTVFKLEIEQKPGQRVWALAENKS